MNSANRRVGLPADVQENIIHNIQKIFPNTVNKELIRAILIKEDWDLEKSLQFLHKTLSSFNKDNKTAGKSNKKNKASNQNNKTQNQSNGDKQLPKPQKQQKKVENVSSNQKKPDLFKKGPAPKQKQKTEPAEQGDWVTIDNPLPAAQTNPAQASSKNSDDKSNSNESKIARKKRLVQNYSIIKHFGEPVNRISAFIKEGIKVMILLRGCSGSGKTTYAHQLLQKEGAQHPGNHIFSTDTYFIQSNGTYCFNHELLQEAHEWNQKLVQLASVEGRSPIFVDNTNTRLWEMREYAMIAVKYGYVLETLEPPTPWFFNEDILSRKTNHSTPRETIRKMLDRYEANLSGEDVIRNLQLAYSPQLTPPQGVIAGLDAPMSKNHKKMLGRTLNNSAEGLFRSNEVKSKINMLMSQKATKSATNKKDDLKDVSVLAKNVPYLTGNVTKKSGVSLSNVRQNSKPPTSCNSSNTSVFPYLRPYDSQNVSVRNTHVAAPSFGLGVSSRKYEYFPRNNIQKSEEQMSDSYNVVSPAGIESRVKPNFAEFCIDISVDQNVKQKEEEEYCDSKLLPSNEVLDNIQDNASDSDETDSEPDNMTSTNSSETSDELEQEVENGATLSYESNLEYVLISNDNLITFQKCHSEMKDIITLEAFRETSGHTASETSKKFEDYLMGFIEKSETDTPVLESDTSESYFEVEQASNSDLQPQILSQESKSLASSSQSCFSAESSTIEVSDLKKNHQLKNGSDNEEINIFGSNKSASHSPKPEFTLVEAMSTSNNNACEKQVEKSPIDTLNMFFPKVSRENLVEIFGTAQFDIDWAVGLLLDSGQEMAINRSSEILTEKNPIPEDSSSNYTKGLHKVFSDSDVKTKLGKVNEPKNPLSEDKGQSFSEFLQENQGISCSSSGQFSEYNKSSLWSSDQKNFTNESNKDFYRSQTSNQSSHSLGAIRKNTNSFGEWDYSKEIPKPMPVEVPKHQRDYSSKNYSKTSVTTNTNYIDFDTLRKVNSNQSQGYVCHDLSKILTGNPDFVSVSTPYYPSSSVLMLDKGTMTIDIGTNQIAKLDSGVERLALMFPRVCRDNLEELFEKCQKDIDWAAGLLLDSGQEMSELYASPETLECSSLEKRDTDKDEEFVDKDQDKSSSEKKQKRRKRGRNSKSDNDVYEELQKQFQSNFVLNENHYTSERMKNHFQKKNPKKMSINESDEPTNVTEVNDEDESNFESLPDNSEEEIVFMLDSDFILQLQSRFGGLLRPNMLGEKTVVNLPLSLARQLHSYVMDSVQQHIQEENIFTDEDEEFARTLQEEENRARGAPSLLEIMDEEVALRKTQKESTNGRSMASALSKQLLLERFPKMDPTTLASILDDTNHSLHQATFVLSSAGHEQAELDNETESPPMEVEEKSALSREEAIKQADAYGDVASQLYELRKDCLRKSQKAYRDGNHSVALYYSDMARWYMERIEKSNSMAAKAILTGYEGWTTLDLHFLQVSEALNVLDLFVDEVIRDLQTTNDRRAVVYVITGRGIHSTGGRPRLKPAVQSRLFKRDLRFVEQNPGMLRVIIPRTALTSYKQNIETSA